MNNSDDLYCIARILAVNHNSIFREGLRSFIESNANMRLVGCAADADTAIGLFAAAQPDLTLLDLNLPHGRAAEVIQSIREMDPEAWIIGLVTYEWDERGAEAIAAGAAAVVSKDLIASKLLELVCEGPSRTPAPRSEQESRARWRTYLRGWLLHGDLRT